ncbi:MAG TPA: hypothetical protein VIU64_20335 [Polyangia bacterium]
MPLISPNTRAQAPSSRPTWVLLLGSMMLLAGGYSLISGMLKLRDPGVVLTIVKVDGTAGSAEEVAIRHELSVLRTATLQPHRAAIRAEAVAEVLLSLFALYATAAVLSRDRHGRALVMGVGALVILYRVAALPVHLNLMRDFAARGAELVARAVLQGTEDSSATRVGEVANRMRAAMVTEPIVVAVLGIAGGLLLLGFFGGRRGRALYGLESATAGAAAGSPRGPGDT